MKTRVLAFVSIGLVFASLAFAQNAKMDVATQDALIQKLEQVLPQINEKSVQAITLRSRLADLYSERARLQDLAAGESECSDCTKAARKDRQTAIRFYNSVVNATDLDIVKNASLQLAHLYRVTGQIKESGNQYKKILKNSRLQSLHAKANLGLGDMAFQSGEMEKAQKFFEAALKGTTPEETAYAHYRIAWTELNTGNSPAAQKFIQKSIGQASKLGMAVFHKDLMRDYATILARNPFTNAEVTQFVQLSPTADQAENLKFLGEESERLGNKKGALLIWTQYARQDEKSEKDKAETQFKMAQNYYDLDNHKKAIEQLNKVNALVKAAACDNCVQVQKDVRNFLVSWSKKEKSEPSQNLSDAYAIYAQMAPTDFEATVWAAQIARARGDSARAYALYEQAALLSASKKQQDHLENTLSTNLEIAEQSQNSELYEKSLRQYLKLNASGRLAGDVRYQIAYLPYKNKNYPVAAQELRSYALDSSNKNIKLRIQAADLALDAQAQTKDDQAIRSNANQFAKVFPEKATTYSEISRKVTVNRLVLLLSQNPTNTNEVEKELSLLKSYNTQKLSAKDLTTQLRTQILAAEKIQDLATLTAASYQLLNVKPLSRDAQNLAQKSLLWVYELRLDFKAAYNLAKKMEMPHLRADQKALRLGLLAELAGLNADAHFKSYIAKTESARNANEIRLKLIRNSRNAWKTYEQYFQQLSRTPDLLAEITLELHLTRANVSNVKRALKLAQVRKSTEGQYLQSLQEREDLRQEVRKIQNHKLQSKSDKALKKSLRKRIRQLDHLKSLYASYSRKGDLMLQAISLTAIKRENQRFASDIQRLPTPKGLRQQERAMYKNLIAEQAKPFSLATQEAQKHLDALFTVNSAALESLRKGLASENKADRKMAHNEFSALKPYLTKAEIRDFEGAIQATKTRPIEHANARRKVEKNPLDPSTLEDLRDLEAKRANGPLIAYLDERLSQLKSATRR